MMNGKVKFMAIALVLGFATMGAYHAKVNSKINANEALFLDNVEALTRWETHTTWRCVGQEPKNNCSAFCGLCGTRVPAKGEADGVLTGEHSCSN